MTATGTSEFPAAGPKITAKQRLEAFVVRAAMRLLDWLPVSAIPRIGAAFGWLMFSVFGFARKHAFQNLDIAFGALPTAERNAIARRCYQFYGANLCEALALGGLRPEQILERVTVANRDVLDTALAQNKGVLLFAAHFGSWEALGAALVANGYAMTTYTGGLKNTLVDELINTRRRASGLDTVPRFPNGARGLLRALKRKRITGLVADQHESTKRHYVAFFGQPVSVAPGPYLLARHSGAPVVFASGVRVGPFRYRVNIETLPPPNPEGNEELDLLEFTQRAFALLERDVRAHPEQYFWMHRRFRPIPAEVELTPVNRRFLEGRLSGPINAFWEHAVQA